MIKQTKEQRQIVRLKKQIEQLLTDVDILARGRENWIKESDRLRNLLGEMELSRNREVKQREDDRFQWCREVTELRTIIEKREAYIGRLCIERGVIK